MAEHIKQEIQLKSQQSGQTNRAEMHTICFTEQEQKMRALKTLAIFWLIALFCVLLPIAHFILVPGFFIGGIIAAKRRWNTQREGIDANGTCPACNNEIQINLDKNADLPQWHDCPQCGDALELQS